MITAGVCENIAPYALNVWLLSLEWLAGNIDTNADTDTLNLDYDIAGGNIEGAGLCRPLGWSRCKWGKRRRFGEPCETVFQWCFANQQDFNEFMCEPDTEVGPDGEGEYAGSHWDYWLDE